MLNGVKLRKHYLNFFTINSPFRIKVINYLELYVFGCSYLEKRSIVIIGGGTGGSTVASFIRKFDRESEITIFEAGKWPTYSPCGMPFALAGTVKGFDKLIELTPTYFEKLKINYHLETKVTKIDYKGRKIVYVKNGEEFEKDFDVLVIATGSKGRRLKVEGSDLKGIFTAKTMDNFKSIDEYIRKRNVKKAAIVGAGFTAAEVAEALTMRNIKTYVLHRGETILRKLFDEDFAKAIMNTMSAHGVVFMPGRHVRKYVGENGYVKKVFTEEGDILDVDMVVEAIGAAPNVELAREAGVEISEKTGAIKVNEYMETNLKDIYAVGDCASSFNAVTGEEESSMLATTAFRQARIAAYNILGKRVKYPGHLETAGLKAFELYAGTTGLINAIAKNKGIDSIAVTLSLPSNPYYYPGAVDIKFKLIVDKSNGRIIGAQALSRKNIANLVTAASFLIMNKMNILDVTVMEWCYAPPLSYGWNVIVEAAFQAAKRLKIL